MVETPDGPRLISALCTEASINSAPLVWWADRIRAAWDTEHSGVRAPLHRKVWEWAYIAAVLHQRGVLRPGARGLGFGVGLDPLTALFAGLGCEIVATDLDREAAAARGWVRTGQFSGALDRLNEHGLCDPQLFAERVSYRTVDMNRIPSDLTGFDFTWSSCALEHLGSIARGQEFLVRQMDCLRPGGVAAHSTEYNVFSDKGTITRGETVLFRRRDIEWLAEELRAGGHDIAVDFNAGAGLHDRYVDIPPFAGPHLKLQVGAFVSTSLVLVVDKAPGNVPVGSLHRVRRRARSLAAAHCQAAVPVMDTGWSAARRAYWRLAARPG